MKKTEQEIVQSDRELVGLKHALFVLERIGSYSIPEELQEASEAEYGLEPEEAIEMAYENVIWEAQAGARFIRELGIDRLSPTQPEDNQ